jgi:hypothetical protein
MVTAAAAARADAIVYNQPAQFPGNFGGTWTSDYGLDGAARRGFWTFDNFRVATTQRVDQVRFQGMYWDFVTPGNNPVAPETTSWELGFWSNNPGFFPQAQLSTQTLPAARVRSQFQGFAFFGGLPNVPLPVYNFTADLPTPFTAQANTTYWLSILSLSPTFNPVWLWMPGTGPDSTSIQYVLADGRVVTSGQYVQNDRAFALVQFVPEPSGLGVMLILGGAAVAGRKARRRAARVAA